MKIIRKSKSPTLKTLENVSINLRDKLNRSAFTHVEVSAYDLNKPELKQEYRISLVPGFEEAECTAFYFKTWSDFLSGYRKLMRGEEDI